MIGQFVWQVHLRQDVLDDAIEELRSLAYEALRELVDQSRTKRVLGRDSKQYDLRVTAQWVNGGAGMSSRDLHITVQLTRGWFGRATTKTFQVQGPDEAASAEPAG
jgi:hypothetical protein